MFKDGKYNYVDTSGNVISRKWFTHAGKFSKDGFAKVSLNGKYNLIDDNGKLVFSEWYETVSQFRNGFAVVSQEGQYNYIDKQGKLLSELWFDSARPFENFGYARVLSWQGDRCKANIIGKNGKPISDVWFDCVYSMMADSAEIRYDNKEYEMRYDGTVNINGKWQKLKAE